MATPQVTVGILAPSAEVRDALVAHIEATQIAACKAVVDQYCASETDDSTEKFLESRPDIIIVDMQDQRAAIKTLHILHAMMPETWLFASSTSTDPQLIIESMQAGAREYLQKPVSGRTLSLAFSRYVDEKQRRRTELIRGKLYSVTSAKGGSGATSVATNLAITVSSLPNTRVALVDLNTPVGDVAAYLNLKTQFTVADALNAGTRLDPVLLDTFMTKAYGISLLAGPRKYQTTTAMNANTLAKLLRVLTQTFTHTFIDMPSSLDSPLLQIVTDLSESILVILTPELPALWRTHRLVLYLSSSGCGSRLRLVVNRDSKQYELSEREITKMLDYPIHWRLPNNYRAAIHAINSGKPIVSVNHSALARSYREMAMDLTGIQEGARKRSWSSVIFGGN